MSDTWAGFWIGVFTGLFFGAMITGGCVSDGYRNSAASNGHAEYYIDTNNFSKQWRWKEVK